MLSESDAFEEPVIQENVSYPHREMKIEALEALKMAEYTRLHKYVVANSWSAVSEQMLFVWGQRAAGWLNLHRASSAEWKFMSTLFMYSTIMISTTSAIMNFVGAGNTQSCASEESIFPAQVIIMYCAGVLSILTGAIASIQSYYMPAERSAQHAASAKEFSGFVREVESILGSARSERLDATTQLKFSRTSFDIFEGDSMPVTAKSILNFKTRYPEFKFPPSVIGDEPGIQLMAFVQ
jgi:hypothetical protein